jgi:geranylgeranyl diphosphate synthase type II
LKTGALFEASLLAAAEICDASIKDKKIFADYAKKIGLAFQINDDLLDVIGDGQLLGKNVGGDINSGKNTFVKLLGLEAAKDEATRLTDEAVNQLRNLKGNIWFLENMAYFLVKRDY